MPGFFLRLAISAFGLWLASKVVPGMQITGGGTLILAAFLLGIVNAIVRPVLLILTLPITVVTLGIFLLVINAAMLGLVASLLDGFVLTGFSPALFGSIIVSFTGWVGSWYVGPRGHFEILVTKRRRIG